MTTGTPYRDWVREGGVAFSGAIEELSKAEFDAPSRLPGWSTRELIAHVALNADALVNLLTWARTGIETPMYASVEARNADIAATARRSPDELCAAVEASAWRLEEAADGLTGEQWQHTVRTAQGREIPAEQVPWMRVREVWVHAVDLGVGITMDDVPADIVDALVVDVLGLFDQRGDDLDAVLRPTDRAAVWTSGDGGVEVCGRAADLAGWLIGRLDDRSRVEAVGGPLPPPPRWL